jgi:hypothetical protein
MLRLVSTSSLTTRTSTCIYLTPRLALAHILAFKIDAANAVDAKNVATAALARNLKVDASTHNHGLEMNSVDGYD